MNESFVRQYDVKVDSKKRITLRNAIFDNYHVSETEDGRIILEPRGPVRSFGVSVNTLRMMDDSVKNLKNKKVSEKIELSEFEN